MGKWRATSTDQYPPLVPVRKGLDKSIATYVMLSSLTSNLIQMNSRELSYTYVHFTRRFLHFVSRDHIGAQGKTFALCFTVLRHDYFHTNDFIQIVAVRKEILFGDVIYSYNTLDITIYNIENHPSQNVK